MSGATALPGVTTEVGLSRVYPQGPDFAHVLGYVGPVSDYDLSKLEDPDPLLQIPRFQIGKLGVEQGLLVGGQEGAHLLRGGGAPGGAARVLLAAAVGLAGQVQAGEHGADLLAVRQAGGHLGAARQPHHQRGGALLQGAEVFVVAVGDRTRYRQAMAREVGHQVQLIGQLGARDAFEEREHVAPERGGDEEVAVLDAGRDALEFHQAADGVVLEPVGEHGFGNGGEDGHADSG